MFGFRRLSEKIRTSLALTLLCLMSLALSYTMLCMFKWKISKWFESVLKEVAESVSQENTVFNRVWTSAQVSPHSNNKTSTQRTRSDLNMIKNMYLSPLMLTELFQHILINVSYLTACYLYQVMMTLHFLNDVAYDTESTQTSKLRHNR